MVCSHRHTQNQSIQARRAYRSAAPQNSQHGKSPGSCAVERSAADGVVHSSVRVMRILDRYIVREVSRHAFLGLVVFTFVFLVPRLVRLMRSEEHTSELQSLRHL